VVECSRKGGGVPYSEYSQFQQLQADETTRVFDARLIDQIIQLVEGLIGQPKKGTSVLDVGCSQGHAINNLLAKAFPKSKFPGFDIF
jgi:2-polyprenyl-3-methyl-5-hydroxy-6-metoxy-1,4-benzoquinol methylase